MSDRGIRYPLLKHSPMKYPGWYRLCENFICQPFAYDVHEVGANIICFSEGRVQFLAIMLLGMHPKQASENIVRYWLRYTRRKVGHRFPCIRLDEGLTMRVFKSLSKSPGDRAGFFVLRDYFTGGNRLERE
jgi:hypothetical protein